MATINGTFNSLIAGTLSGTIGTPGPAGQPGPTGATGAAGSPGVGVPAGGSTGQVLRKLSGVSYDTGWLTLPADYITSVSAPLAVASGNLSVNLSAYLPLAGGIITGDVLSYNGSRFQTIASGSGSTYSLVTPDGVVVSGGGVGGNQISIQWDGVTFADGKQTVKYPGASILTGYALESWVTAGFYPLSGNPSGFLTASALTPYLTSATAASTYQTLAGMSSYLTTSAAASTYAVIAAGQPVAGSTGQVLTKQSGTNYDSIWTTIVPGDRYLTSSTTSNTISNGNKTFTIGTGLSYTPTQNITISYNASNHMHGEVLTYNSGTGVLTVDINHHTGSGTYAAWVVNVGGVTPATSVAWGALTGTLSAQTDLQNALDLKLAATTAATTYYPLTGNPSGFLTSAPVTSVAGRTGVITLANTDISGLGTLAVVNDAPSDGSQYARKNAAWEIVSGGGGGYTPKTVLEVTSSGRTITSPDFGKVLVFTNTANGIIYLPIAPLGSQVLISFIQEDCKQVEGLSGVFVFGLNFNDRLIHYNSGLVTMTCVNSDNATFSFWRADNPLLFTTSWPAAGTVLSEGCVDTTGGAGYVDAAGFIFNGSFTHSIVIANGTNGSTETLTDNSGGCWYPAGYCTYLGPISNVMTDISDDSGQNVYVYRNLEAALSNGDGTTNSPTPAYRPYGTQISDVFVYGGNNSILASDGDSGYFITSAP